MIINTTTEKISGEIQLMAVTQKQLAKALGLGTTRINQLIDEGIVVRDETSRSGQVMLLESLQNYFLSKNVNLGAGSEAVNFWKEKGLNERAKRQLNEIKVRKAEGELYEAKIVENAFIEMLTVLRSNLLGLPSKMATMLEGKNRGEIYDLLTSEIESRLAELSELDFSSFQPDGDDE